MLQNDPVDDPGTDPGTDAGAVDAPDVEAEYRALTAGEDNTFFESYAAQFETKLLQEGFGFYGAGFLFLMTSGFVFVVGWMLWSRARRLGG